jgi:hypothetical protein
VDWPRPVSWTLSLPLLIRSQPLLRLADETACGCHPLALARSSLASPATLRRSSSNAPPRAGAAQRKVAMRTPGCHPFERRASLTGSSGESLDQLAATGTSERIYTGRLRRPPRRAAQWRARRNARAHRDTSGDEHAGVKRRYPFEVSASRTGSSGGTRRRPLDRLTRVRQKTHHADAAFSRPFRVGLRGVLTTTRSSASSFRE